MKAMLLHKVYNMAENQQPLQFADIPVPEPTAHEVLIKVRVCGVCHTELDEIEGRTPPPSFPVVPGHQVVGTIDKIGSEVTSYKVGDRVGVAWIFAACGDCKFCNAGKENLCDQFLATGRDANGGYAEYMVANENFVYLIPESLTDIEAAPLLCAGAVGYRALQLSGLENGENLGLTGFGGSNHLVLKMAKYLYPKSNIFVFARNEKERDFAMELGAFWAGDIDERPPEKLQCIVDATPVWKPVVEALLNLEKGGRLVINAIRKEEVDKDYLQTIGYDTHLWLEKEIKTVANVTPKDVRDFLALAAEISIKPEIQEYPLEAANKALYELKTQKIRGAKVLLVSGF